MKSGLRTGWAVATVAGMVLGVSIPAASAAAGRTRIAASAAQEAGSAEVLREIDDPATGNRWLLERDGAHLGGPGRLVLLAKQAGAAGRRAVFEKAVTPDSLAPVIRAGDAVILEAHTAVMDAELETFALTAAPAGSPLRVRLKLGGRVVTAIALAPGRAEWTPESGARP